jgi:hypothetical protein
VFLPPRDPIDGLNLGPERGGLDRVGESSSGVNCPSTYGESFADIDPGVRTGISGRELIGESM